MGPGLAKTVYRIYLALERAFILFSCILYLFSFDSKVGLSLTAACLSCVYFDSSQSEITQNMYKTDRSPSLQCFTDDFGRGLKVRGGGGAEKSGSWGKGGWIGPLQLPYGPLQVR